MIEYINDIRKHYEILTPRIMANSLVRPSWWVTPYALIGNWPNIMSPIEFMAWQAIRGFGKIPLYPQYPVDKYFLDFGNPFLKIAVECDGKEFHQDIKKDIRRDEKLFEKGWKVYRISGSDCNRIPSDDYYNIESKNDYPDEQSIILDDFYNNTIEGLLKALAIYYCDYTCYYNDEPDELPKVLRCLTNRISLKDKIEHEYLELWYNRKYER